MPDPELLAGRYELGEVIGAGGAATVRRGRDLRLERNVAIKILDAEKARTADPAGHDRFLREGRSAARFTHPHAVTTYDAGEDDGRLFIVMEHVDGPTLAQRIAEPGRLTEPEAIRIGTQVLGALAAAHRVGLIHRDVKPANVLLDQRGNAKLADFGIARRFDDMTSALTADGMVIGTRGYLAPEQARGEEVGPSVDIYAAGALLFEALTGERPPMTDPAATRGADPRTRRPDVSPVVAIAVSTALAGDPATRFESAESMAMALDGRLPPTELDVAAAPTRAIQSAAPAVAQTMTMPITRAPAGSTATSPLAPVTSGPPVPPPRSGRPGGWLVGIVALLVVAGVVLALAMAAGRPSLSSTPSASTAPFVTTEPPAVTTVPSTTATVPPTVPATVPPPAERIAGFPQTDDLDEFIEILRENKEIAGKQSRKLGDELRAIVREDDEDKRQKKIDEAVDKIEEWVDDGELDLTVANRAVEFLDELD